MKKELPIFGIFIFISFIFWGSITLSEEYFANLSIPLKIVLIQPEYAIEGDVPEYLNCRVRTTGWEILKLKYFQKPIFEIKVNKPLENYVFSTSTISNEQLKLSSAAKIVSITPEVIRLNFNVSVERRIKIYPRLNYTLKEGYEIVKPIEVEPQSILIRGSRKVVSQIDSLPTETIYLSDLSDFTLIQTKVIDTLSNLLVYERLPVNISIDVQQIVDRDFEKVQIELINVPENKEVILLPSFVDLKLRGGIKILGALAQDTLKAFVDYRKYLIDIDKEIEPEFDLPAGVRIVDYFPKQFKLIVRK